jgi:hypothetical protein
MSWTRFFRRRYWDEERARELEAYLEAETDENIARGMSPEEARYAARRKLGNTTLIREEIYRINSLGWLETLWQDLRYGLRQLKRNPGFTAVAVLTLGIGIGAAALVFGVVYGAILNPYPYRDADRIVQMAFLDKQGIRGFMAVNAHDLETVRRASTVEDAMLSDLTDPITNVSGYPEDIAVARFSGNAFNFLGVAPLFGRTLTREDQDQRAVVLGYTFCRAHYQCDPDVLGRKLALNRRQFIIVGVMPPQFAWEGAAAFIGPVDTNAGSRSPIRFCFRRGRASIGDTIATYGIRPAQSWVWPKTPGTAIRSRLHAVAHRLCECIDPAAGTSSRSSE